MKRAVTALATLLIAGAVTLPSEPAKADDAAAFIAGAAIGALFPFVSSYHYHPTGYYYVRSPRYYRYPSTYYRHDPYVGGYVYVGPRWRQWYGYRQSYYPRTRYYYPQTRYYYSYPRRGFSFGFRW